MLKQEIKVEIKNKLDSLEQRIKIYFEEHNQACNSDFKSYEAHFKENLGKMTMYMQEMHDGHIAEITNFKREKDDQVLINSMLVKRVQKIERYNQSQTLLNE
jgi:hypothetical protein